MRTKHLIIGAGIAGIALRRTLGESAVVLDPSPAGYKIGESIIPEQFFHHSMREVLPYARRLASYSPKIGTTFIGDGQVACFPLQQHRLLTMHVYRPEFEAMLLDRFGIEVQRERVLEVDPERRTVRTDKGTWESDGPILDCSGPAMVVANAMGIVADLWPVHAVWAYYDVQKADDARFWREAHARGWSSISLDQPSGHLTPDPAVAEFSTTRTTTLIQVRPGTWMWQIPLWDRQRLSVGVVTRGEPLTAEDFRAVVREHGSPAYTLSERPEAGPDPLDRLHRRSGFARKATRAATKDFILVGDAFAFADPIYSVGTGLATNKAILVGEHLLRHGWSAEDAEAYSDDYEVLLKSAVRAFDFWYSGEVMRDDSTAMEVQTGFLVGGAFHQGAFEAYRSAVTDAAALAEEVLTLQVSNLLGGHSDIGAWRLVGAASSEGGSLITTWFRAVGKPAEILVRRKGDGAAFLSVGNLAISYGIGDDLATPATDAEALALIEKVAAEVKRRAEGWEQLIEL